MRSEHDICAEHNMRPPAVFPDVFEVPMPFPATSAALAWTRWDMRILARAALVAGVALGLAWLVTAATDEGGISWGERAGRTLPLTPACAAIGAWVALAPVRLRGEALALAALGRSPAQVAAAAVAGGALVAMVAAASIGFAPVDITAFFPRAARASAWAWQNDAFVEPVQGLRVGSDGAPVRLAREMVATLIKTPRHGRAAAALATAIAGLAMPLLVAHALLARSMGTMHGPRERSRARNDGAAALASAATVGACLVLFQAAAAQHLPALLGAIPPTILLAFAVWRYRVAP
jgi:hypothetical protein